MVALEKAFERNTVVLADNTDADFFALAEDELEAAVQVFYVRGGRIRGQRGWITEKVDEVSTAELVEHLLQQAYGEVTAELSPTQRRGRKVAQQGSQDTVAKHRRTAELAYRQDTVPRTVYVSTQPEQTGDLENWLSELRGSRVTISVPQRGDKAQLLETVAENARQALALHKSRRAGDLTTRSASLHQLQEALELPDALMRIECYDISHVQGTNVVASMVVFEDGLPRKGEYRKFAITGDAARDDTASMYDVIHRRFTRHLEQQRKAAEGGVSTGEVTAEQAQEDNGRVFAYPPNLVIVDGGPPQVAAAQRALDDLGITDVYVVGLAKRLEEVWLPDDEFPLILPRASEGLYLLQRVRDEAHRFAITFHREKRSKSMTVSALDVVPGLGPAKHKALMKHFGSVRKIRAATVEDIARVNGFGPGLAERVVAALESGQAPSAAVDVGTGELLD